MIGWSWAGASRGPKAAQSSECETLLVLGRGRIKVRKSAQDCGLQKFEVCDRGGEFVEATLTVGNFGAEQVLMMAIDGVAFQIFVGSVAHGNGGARQGILDPPVKAR